jgi:hypothetical protein
MGELESITTSWIFHAFAGGAVGVGVMIITLARWGKKLLGIDRAGSICPYVSDHPKLQEFMGQSHQDRKDLRDFLEDINDKVVKDGQITARMEGKLDVLLQGARVRWNGAMPTKDRGE